MRSNATMKSDGDYIMAINPFDPKESSPEEISKQFGGAIKAELYEIGYTFIGKREYNCDEDRAVEKKRFKIMDRKRSLYLDLWHGTSKWVDCDELSDNDEEENPTVEIIKSTYISIVVTQLADDLEITLHVVDSSNILEIEGGFSNKDLKKFDDLMTELHDIKQTIAETRKREGEDANSRD